PPPPPPSLVFAEPRQLHAEGPFSFTAESGHHAKLVERPSDALTERQILAEIEALAEEQPGAGEVTSIAGRRAQVDQCPDHALLVTELAHPAKRIWPDRLGSVQVLAQPGQETQVLHTDGCAMTI